MCRGRAGQTCVITGPKRGVCGWGGGCQGDEDSILACAWATERAGPVSQVRIIGEALNLERNFRKQTDGYGNGVEL